MVPTDRQTERHNDRMSYTQKDRETNRRTERQEGRQTERQNYPQIQKEIETDIQNYTQIQRKIETERQNDRMTYTRRQTDKQKDGKTVYCLQIKQELIQMENLSGTLQYELLLYLLTNIGLGWKGLLGTNTLSWLETFVNYVHKRFCKFDPLCFKHLVFATLP